MVHEVYTGFSEPARMVVRNSRQLADVWANTFLARSEHPHIPRIDFFKETILVAAQGGRPSSGYDISIDRVSSKDGVILVDVTTSGPDRGCPVLAVITSPVVMVRIPRTEARVEFVEHTRSVPCH
jgi:hypothetical protein